MSQLLVFNDSHKSDGFVDGVDLINKKLAKHGLRVKLQFIEDYESDEGEYAWYISVVPDDLPTTLGECVNMKYKDTDWGELQDE